MPELIVVCCHGADFIGQCQESLSRHAPGIAKVYIDTASIPDSRTNIGIPGIWPTGCLLWAYRNMHGFDKFLIMQDSMTAIMDPLPWFRDQWLGAGCVAWQRFPMDWDTKDQADSVTSHYTSRPAYGIVGPVMYTSRESLDLLEKLNLLPDTPSSRITSCATERAWAFAFEEAGLPVVGPGWDVLAMTTTGVGPFKKVWANRP